ncbi:hypothetical protein CEW46_23905 [Bacillus cereus]|nr:hypothetical protein CEW46_23905 [Bacillus cereus]
MSTKRVIYNKARYVVDTTNDQLLIINADTGFRVVDKEKQSLILKQPDVSVTVHIVQFVSPKKVVCYWDEETAKEYVTQEFAVNRNAVNAIAYNSDGRILFEMNSDQDTRPKAIKLHLSKFGMAFGDMTLSIGDKPLWDEGGSLRVGDIIETSTGREALVTPTSLISHKGPEPQYYIRKVLVDSTELVIGSSYLKGLVEVIEQV